MNSVNRSEIIIESLSHARILNGLMRNKIRVLSCKKELKRLTLVVCSADVKKLQEHFDELGYNYIVSKEIGPRHAAKKIFKRYGIIVGLLLSISLLYVMASTIININISGIENVSNTEVEQIIKENNIKKFMFKSQINLSELNRSICAVKGVASASLNIKGVNLNIRIQEELFKEDSETGSDLGIFAKYDSIITKVTVESGTAVVKAGDTVKAGTLLIAPYYKLNEETNIPTLAKGEISGRIWIKSNTYFLSEQTERIQTGNKTIKSEVFIAGQLMGSKPTPPFQIYEEEVRIVRIINVIPIVVVYHTYHETEDRLIIRDFEEEKELIIADKEREIEKNIDADKTIVRKWNIVKDIDKTHIISIYYELEGRIDEPLTKGELDANRNISHRQQ